MEAAYSETKSAPPAPAAPASAEPTVEGGAGAGLPGFLQAAAFEQRRTARAGLTVSQPDDPAEREAERVAGFVLGSARPAPAAIGAGPPPGLARQTEPGPAAGPAVAQPPTGSGGTALGAAAASGQPLSPGARASLEPLFGRDLGQVRVHTGTPAGELSRSIQARAFTRGRDIFFAPGRYDPTSRSGLALLAHELTHVVQGQRAGAADLQAALEDDFAGQQEVEAATSPARPANRIRVPNKAGVEVYAPYRTYQLSEIPTHYDRQLRIKSIKALEILRRPGEEIFQAYSRLGAVETVSLGDLRTFQQNSGNQLNLMIAWYDGQVHLVGFDTYAIYPGSGRDPAQMYQGYVEALEGTSGVGKNLLVERITRLFLAGVGEMRVEVNEVDRTEAFHARLQEVAGHPLQPSGHYVLGTRHMANILVAWSERLTEYQRSALFSLASATAEPTVAAVQAILQMPFGPGGGGGTTSGPGGGPLPSGDLPPEIVGAVNKTLRQLQTNSRTPVLLDSFEALRSSERINEVVSKHDGLAQIGGQVFEVSTTGQQVTTRQIEPRPVTLALPAPAAASAQSAGPLLPASAGGGSQSSATPGTIRLPAPPGQYVTSTPPVLNLRPSGNIEVGGTVIPPSVTTAQAGDLIVVGGRAEWVVADARSGRPVAGIFSGGQLYRVALPGAGNLTLDESGRVIPPQTIRVDGRTVVVEPVPIDANAPAQGATRVGGLRGSAVRGVGVAGGLLAVANDLLAPYAATLAVQRQTIQRARAEIDFWTQFGADPTWGMWDADEQTAVPWTTESQTGVILDSWRFPYVVDINVAAFQSRLPGYIGDFQELEVFLDLAGRLFAIQKRDGRYYAKLSKPDYSDQKLYDLTETIEQIRLRTIEQGDARMQAELRGLPPDELGNVFRLRAGASTPLYRSARGAQPILSDQVYLGPNPWVRTLGRRIEGGAWSWFRYGHGADRVLVAPANGDALRAAQVAAYRVHKSIEDTLGEVKEGGRPILSESRPNDRLEGFVAGADTETPPRFGVTRYFREPNDPNNWTAAVGELRQFWVNADELEPVGGEQVKAYANPPGPAAP
jgi:hypothetical protein